MSDRRVSGPIEEAALGGEDRAVGYEIQALAALRTAGYRITSPRVQVIRALAKSTKSLSAYDIHQHIVGVGGRIDIVSVYRILATLEEIRMVHHVGLVNAYVPARLAETSQGISQVVVFEGKDEVLELNIPPNLLQLLQSQARKHGFEPTAIKIEIMAK